MRANEKLAALLVGLAILAAAPATAQTWAVTLPAGDGPVQSTDLNTAATNVVTGTTATVNLTCQNAADCPKVNAQLTSNGAVVQPLGRVPAGSNSFAVPSSILQGTVMDLAFALDGKSRGAFKVTAGTAPSSGTTGGTTSGGTTGTTTGTAGTSAPSPPGPPSLATLLTTDCAALTVTVQDGGPCVSGSPPAMTIGYDAKGNCGAIVVTPSGNVLARAVDTFDENDELRVIVYGDARLLPTLKVERTSAFRDVQTVRIVGAGEQVPSQLVRQGSGVCTTAEFRLDDFAPGQGKFQISSFQTNEWMPLGTGDFNVDPLYSGILSLGAAWTDLVDPGFKIATGSAGTSVVALGDDSDNDLLYTLFYTPYVWGKRDLEKRYPWYRHVNPTFGIVPEDVDDNAMVGVTVDLPAGVLLTFGRHFRRVTVLPADTGLSVGSPFSGTADQLPTADSWEDENFFAVTIDLRAAVQLFTAAFGGGTGGN